MLPNFYEQPGALFVVATLLPLLSFVLIFLASGAWAVLRPYRETEVCGTLYRMFGGDRSGRTAAYVALGAIGLAFLYSLTGLVSLLQDEGAKHAYEHQAEHFGREAQEAEKKVKRLDQKVKDLAKNSENVKEKEAAGRELVEANEKLAEARERVEEFEGAVGRVDARYSARFDWIRLYPAGASDPNRGTAVQLGYRIDHLSAIMFVMVTFVATLIHLFSIGYMSEELEETVVDHHVHADTEDGHYRRRGRFGRFFMFLSLFCFSMLNLVLADNLFQVFISWELVGICSYLLIGFYFERQSASDAANKAFIVNRVGDAGFVIGLMIVWTYFGTFNFQEVFNQVRSPARDAQGKSSIGAGQIVRGSPTGDWSPSTREQEMRIDPSGTHAILFPLHPGEDFHGLGEDRNIDSEGRAVAQVSASPGPGQYSAMPYWVLIVAGLGVFLGCVGKSAQFPLQVWLPDAMEGPTPVSALIHAATMVAAGVYLVGRCYPLFTPEVLLTIAYVGGITLFVAASVAVVMTDIKKVLAYSTVSQLGYMMLGLGVGGWTAGLLHLLTHAFFKALLFLGSGSVIFGCHHQQEMTKMGGLYCKMRITALTMLVGVLAIAGIPLFSGWYSKDGILGSAFGFAFHHREHMLLFLLPLVTAGITTFYMFRMWFMTFTGPPRDPHVYEHAHESPWTMTVPLILLAIPSVMVAWGNPLWDPERSWLEHQLHHAQPVSVQADFGHVAEHGEDRTASGVQDRPNETNQRLTAVQWGDVVGKLALASVALGLVFALLIYYYRVLDPAESKEQFPAVYNFLWHKWYFDEVYSAVLVRPALVVAHWLKWFDLAVIDGIVHGLAYGTVGLSRANGEFDKGVIDGLVNLIASVFSGVGGWLRNVQTGSLRNYVLFLALAAVVIFVALAYFVSMALAG